MSRPESSSLAPIAIGAIAGNLNAEELFVQAMQDPEQAPRLAEMVLRVARENAQLLEQIQEKLRTSISPALLRGRWEHDGGVFLDIEMNGSRSYCQVAEAERESAALAQHGEEIVVAQVDGGTPLFVHSLDRPFEAVGRLGVVSDVHQLECGEYEIEIEGGGESFTCRATREVAEALEGGEVDALGGLPIMARYESGLVWELRQKRGKSEGGGNMQTGVTLDDHAGYAALRREFCNLLGLHVLAQEPKLLIELTPLGRVVRPKSQGILSTGLPGTGKTHLSMAAIGSLEREVGVAKARAKLAALRLFAATHPEDALYERACQPDPDAALAELRDALQAQYRGFVKFHLDVECPTLPGDLELVAFSEALVSQYGIGEGRRLRKYVELETRVANGRSDFMILQVSKADYIQPLVGAGLNALSAQLRRCVQHDDVALLCMPEAEVLLARRGHQSRFYTDELVSTLLEVLDGPVPCPNLFVIADGNRPDMVDEAFAARRLTHIAFPGLVEADRGSVVEAVLKQTGTEPSRIGEVTDLLVDQSYSDTHLCELVMADESRLSLTSDHTLTPAMIRNVVRGAYSLAAAKGRPEIEAKDVELAWQQEMDAQSLRFGEEAIAEILGLDRKQAARIVQVQRRAG